MENISESKIYSYNNTLDIITLYNFKNKNLTDDFFYIKKDDVKLKHINNYYIKLKPIKFYFKNEYGEVFSMYSVEDKSIIDTLDILYIDFKINKIALTLEEIKNNSVLKGFSRIIDDNYFFSDLPKTNELFHSDNYVNSHINYNVNYELEPVNETDVYLINAKRFEKYIQNWDKYNITLEEIFNNNDSDFVFSGGRGHRKL